MAARISLVFYDLSSRFPKNNPIAFEVLMVLAVAHLFGFYNPKQLAVSRSSSSTVLYGVERLECLSCEKDAPRFMVKQAAEKLKPVMSKSAATRSRAGTTLSIDNSVMDRFGKLLRCTWSWYRGRYHKIIQLRLTRYCVHHPSHSITFTFAVLSKTRSLSYDQSRFTHIYVDTAQNGISS